MPKPSPPDDCFDESARRWVLVAAILGSSLAFLIGTIVNVALPAVQRDLGASGSDVQWILNSYLLPLSALLLPAGAAGDRYGRQRIFAIGLGIFALASVGCALAPSVAWLLVARAVQGVGGALLVPASLALITAAYPADERGKAIGTWAGFSALTTALGPVAGGLLVDTLSWRWAFGLVVPLALATLVLTLRKVPRSVDPDAKPADIPGSLLAVLGLGALTYAAISSSDRGWGDAVVIGSSVGGLIGLGVFWWWEHRTTHPMLPPGLFASHVFSGANALTLALYAALNGVLFLMPFYLIENLGLTATQAGAAFLPFSLIMAGLSRPAGSLYDRFGARRPLIVGPILVAAGFALFAVSSTDGATYWTAVLPGFLVMALGMTISVAPLTTAVMNSVDSHQSGTASGVNNTASRVAGLLAIAVLGTLALGRYQADLTGRLSASDLSTSVQTRVLELADQLGRVELPDGLTDEQASRAKNEARSAFESAYREVMWACALLALLSSLSAAWLLRGPGADPPQRAKPDSQGDLSGFATKRPRPTWPERRLLRGRAERWLRWP